jgi:hypothetical protein
MKKLLILSFSVVGIAAAGLFFAPSLVNAQGAGNGNGNGNGQGYQQSLTNKAQVLGMTTDELKKQLESKTILQLAKDKGLTEDQFHQMMEVAAEARWKANGLSQSEIDSRKKAMEERQANCDGTGTGGGMHQYGKNR